MKWDSQSEKWILGMKTDVLEDGGLYIVTSLKIDDETEICMHNASNVVKVILDV